MRQRSPPSRTECGRGGERCRRHFAIAEVGRPRVEPSWGHSGTREEPADAVVRECQEEAGVLVAPERLTLVDVSPTFSYPSGDQCQYIDIVFLCRLVKGTAVVNDEESDCVQWFQRGNLPPLSEYIRRQIGLSLAERGPATFVVHGQDRPLSKP